MPELDESLSGPADQPDGPNPDRTAATPVPRAPTARPRRNARVWLLLITMLALGAAYIWYCFLPFGGANPVPVATSESIASVAGPATADLAALQRSLDDAASVNRALREQVLGLTQRVGLVEDGLAGVERGAAPGVDAVLLAEADFLLRLGEERLRLFADVNGARETYALADAQLAEVSDPRATSVRQTLALERDALAAIAVADLPVILGRLDGLAEQVGRWPLKGSGDSASKPTDKAAPGWWSRLTTTVDRYFRVRRVDPGEQASGGPLLRERIALDLSRARLLLVRGEGAAALAAIESVRGVLQTQFDTDDGDVGRAVKVLDEVRSAPLSPQLPTLGEARRELARLRGVALQAPAANAPAATTTTTDEMPAAAPSVLPPPVPAEAPAADATVPNPVPGAGAADDTAAPGPGDDAGPDEPTPDPSR